jgi:uncharacterized protein with GYD domain
MSVLFSLPINASATDDETVSAFLLKNGALGNAKSQTLRAFRREEMEAILAKIK